MRIERPHLSNIADIPSKTRNHSADSATGQSDSVNLRFAVEVDRVISIDGSSYDPKPVDIALSLIGKGFDR